MSHAMAPRKGGIMKGIVKSHFITFFIGISLRARSHAKKTPISVASSVVRMPMTSVLRMAEMFSFCRMTVLNIARSMR